MDGPKKKGFRCLEASHDVILHQKKKPNKPLTSSFRQNKELREVKTPTVRLDYILFGRQCKLLCSREDAQPPCRLLHGPV